MADHREDNDDSYVPKGVSVMYQIYCDGKLLYDPRQKAYLVNDPTLELAVNTSGILSFSMPPTHPSYNVIRKLRSVVTLYQDGEWLFSGRVLNDSVGFDRTRKVEVEGELGYLNDSNQRCYVCDGLSPEEWFATVIGRHNADVDEWKRFMIGVVTVTDSNNELYYSSTTYDTSWDTVKEKCFGGSCGGYVRTRHVGKAVYIDWLKEYPNICSQAIRFGENLLDLNHEVKGEDMATVVIPLGARLSEVDGEYQDTESEERLTIAGVNNGKDYLEDTEASALYGRIVKCVVHENITQAANLYTAGMQDLEDAARLLSTLTLNAVDLHLLHMDVEKISLGDSIRVVSAPHGLDTYMQVSAMTIRLAQPENSSITLGRSRKTLQAESDSSLSGIREDISYIYGQQRSAASKLNGMDIRIKEFSSEITKTAEQILMTVSENYLLKTDYEKEAAEIRSSITQTSSSILQVVSAVYVKTSDYNTAIGELQASIEMKVDLDNLISSINMSAETVTIHSSKLNLSGYVTMTDLSTSGKTSIYGGNIQTNTITADKLTIGTGGNLYNRGYDTFDNITEDILYYTKSTYAAVSLTSEPGCVYYGQQALQVTATGGSAYVYLGHKNNYYGCIPVQAGKTYLASCYVKSDTEGVNAYLYVSEHTAVNSTNSALSYTTAKAGTSWTRIVRSFTVTSTYPYVSIRVQNSGGAGVTMWFDAIMIEEVASAAQSPGIFKPANTTVIDGGHIITGTVDASVINVTDLKAFGATIGGWTIGTSALYNGTTSMTSTVEGTYIGTNGIRQYNSGTKYVNITGGVLTAYGATISGTLTASAGTIAGFTLNSSALYKGKTSLTSAASGVYVSTSGISTGNGSAWITMANGQIYGTGGGGTASTGYVCFNNYWTDSGVYGTRIAGRSGLFILAPRIGVGSYMAFGSEATVTEGYTGTVSQALVKSITNNGNGSITWTYGTFKLIFKNGLLTGYSIVS